MSLILEKHNMAEAIDFDGTITDIDVVHGLLEAFATDQAWR